MSQLKILGSVLTILEGNVTQESLYPLAHFYFGLGGSTVSDLHHIGETLIFEGIPYISWVEEGVLKTQAAPSARSAFLMGLTQEEPTQVLHWKNPSSLEEIYKELLTRYPEGVAVSGRVTMHSFEGVYLKKAPIYHENINTHHDLYWSSVQKIKNAPFVLFGVVLPSHVKSPRAFYHNPQESGSLPFQSHTHAALLHEGSVQSVYTEATSRMGIWQSRRRDFAVPEGGLIFEDNYSPPSGTAKARMPGQPKPILDVVAVYHTLTQSVVQEGNFDLFPLRP